MALLYFAFSNHMTSNIVHTFINLCTNYEHICLHVSLNGQFRSVCFIDNQNIKGTTNRQRYTMREGHNSQVNIVIVVVTMKAKYSSSRLNLCFSDNSTHVVKMREAILSLEYKGRV